ncbi:MAG: aminotransferase, partial [Raoultibacter sp.]
LVGVVSPATTDFMLAVANAGHEVVELTSPHTFVVPDAYTARSIGLRFDAAVLANPTYPTSRLLPRTTLVNYLET